VGPGFRGTAGAIGAIRIDRELADSAPRLPSFDLVSLAAYEQIENNLMVVAS